MHLRDWIRTDWVQSAALLSLDVNFLDVNRNGETRSKAWLISTPKPPIKVHFNCLHLQIDSFKLLYIFIIFFHFYQNLPNCSFFPILAKSWGATLTHTNGNIAIFTPQPIISFFFINVLLWCVQKICVPAFVLNSTHCPFQVPTLSKASHGRHCQSGRPNVQLAAIGQVPQPTSQSQTGTLSVLPGCNTIVEDQSIFA